MKEDKRKFLILPSIAVIIVAFLISLVIYPVTQLSPKELPIGVATLDKGAVIPAGEMNLGKEIKEKISQNTNSAIKWIALDTQTAVDKGFEDRDFYAAIVIPEDFTQKQMAAKMGQGKAAPITVTIDQGQSPQVAVAIEQSISKMTSAAGMTTTVEYLHPVSNDMKSGTAHIYVFILTWFSILVGSIILFLYLRNAEELGKSKRLLYKRLVQAGAGLVASFIIGLTVAFIASSVLDLSIPYMTTALFLTLASFCLIMMIIGVMAWTGIGGIALFILLMCLGLMASNMPYEMLPEFWQNWIYPWIPMRFASEGIRDIFYMDSGVWNHGAMVLSWIGAGGLALLLLSVLRPQKSVKTGGIASDPPADNI